MLSSSALTILFSTQLPGSHSYSLQAELGDLVRGTGSYLKGLWDRLNGGGRRSPLGGLKKLGLPLPPATRKESDLVSYKRPHKNLIWTVFIMFCHFPQGQCP